MKFIIMHATNAHWESDAIPSAELIARVGALLGDMARRTGLHGAEGLCETSRGVRLQFSAAGRTVIKGPYHGSEELPAGFTVVRTRSLEEAIDWATREAEARGPEEVLEIDIRPICEPWDVGMGPAPANLETQRYMILRKATAATESGAEPSPARRVGLLRLIEESTRAGVHLASASLRPSRRGRRYVNARSGVSAFDGPFTETKELLGGYVIISAASLEEVDAWARRYLEVVDTEQVDVRELE